MWPWPRREPPPDLREALEKVKRDHIELRAEMDEWIDRLGRLVGRLSKRAALDIRAATQDNGAADNQESHARGGWVIHHGKAVRRL